MRVLKTSVLWRGMVYLRPTRILNSALGTLKLLCFSYVDFVQVYLFWGKDMPELWEELDPKFLQVLRRRWTDNQQRTKRSSLSHLEVSQVPFLPVSMF